MNKFILLILYFAAYSIADNIKEVDIHQFVYRQMSEEIFFEEYMKKYHKELNLR